MRKMPIIAGACLLAAAAGVHAYTGFETAPKTSSDSDFRMARTLSGSKPAALSNKPFKGKSRKVASKASSAEPKIYGMMQYSDSWWNLPEDASYPYGCYEISKSKPTPSEMYAHPNLRANGGGCYTDRQVHYRLWEVLTEDPWFNNYYMVVNTDDWYYVQDPIQTHEQESVASDMTYDPISKKIYAAIWSNFDGGNNKLAVVDAKTGTTTDIATIPDMACLVANNFGELYGVELLTGVTYRIDKETGECVAIGNSGISPKYMQSACIDPQTNVIYWLATLSDETANIYTLNTSTGKADLYIDLPDNSEYTCAFIEAPTKGLNAPAALSDFSVTATDQGSKIKFTAPVKAFDGSAPGNMTVKVYADGKEIYSKSVEAGASDEFVSQLGDGRHSVVAFAENSVGEGEKTIVEHYTGNDVPAAPSNLNLAVADNVATLTWDAPVAGLHGGTIEADKLRYNVVRYPGAELVGESISATSFTETLPEGMANYYYTVTSLIGEQTGGMATSNSWFAGETFDVPYSQTFDSEEGMNGFTILDGDGDDASWEYSSFWKAAWSKYNKYEQSDNWLITPPIKLEANSTYRVTFRACAFDEESPERFEVMFGRTPTAEGMTKTIVAPTITNNTKLTVYTGDFTTDASGVGYIGFHAISPANSYRLIVDDIEVKLTAAAGVPAAVADLTATPASDGSGKVNISFTTPDKTQDGSALKNLTAVEIFRDAEASPVKKFENPATATKLEWMDENAPAGDVTYRVIASNDAGRGIEASVPVFVGFDNPLPASNLKLIINDDNELVLTWKAPAKTVSGLDINPEHLSYTVTRSDGTVMVEKTKNNSFTDVTQTNVSSQKMIYYQVETFYGNQAGEIAIGDYVIVGDPLQLPFKESFSEKSLENAPWVISRVSGHTDMRWSLQSQATTPDATAQDNDGGFASFVAYDQPSGLMERMTSPKIDLFSADHPVLKFYIYTTTANSNETLAVQISNNDHDFHTLKELTTKDNSTGWKEVSIEIPRKYCTESAMISFLGTTARGFNIHIDNIRIENGDGDLLNYDLEAVSLDVPALMPDQEAKITFTVYNNGLRSVDNYSVSLLVNGNPVIKADAEKAIAPGETYQYVFKLTPEQSDLNQTFRFKGRLTCELDTDPENNETDEVMATVGVSGLNEIGIEESSIVSVYTLDGICLMKNIHASELQNLTKGLYIVRFDKKSVKLKI